MMSPRTGRPPKTTGEPKALRCELRLSENEMNKISACADKLGISKAEALLKGIDLLAESIGI